MRRWIAGCLLIGAALIWLIVDRVLGSVYPGSWGGPNIGGGALVVVALIAVVAGVLVLTADRRTRRARQRDRHQPGDDQFADQHDAAEPSRRARAGAVTIDGVLVIALIVTYLVTSGGADKAVTTGAVGVTVDAAGAPLLVLQVCHGSITRVTVVGPNRGTRPNETFADLTAPAPLTATMTIDPNRPPAGWTGLPASLGPTARQHTVLIASAEGHDSELRQVSFTAADLSTLNPQIVQYSTTSPSRTSIAGFRGISCG